MSQVPAPTAAPPRFDVGCVRKEFPILAREVHGQPLVYLDNAATTQKPRAVIDALVRYYTEHNANIHRGVHYLSEAATQAHENARRTVQRFVNAREAREIVFTRNATEGINLVAQSVGQAHVGEGDEIVITGMEHHSNIVPWQMLCERTGARLKVVPITVEGELVSEEVERLIGPRTKLVAVVHLSNSLGTVNPVERIIELAHQHDAAVLVDGAQSAYHLPIDVQALDCDFYVATGHKLYGPTGIGLLYGKAERLDEMPPYQGGGDMISSVTFEKTTYNELPYKFEAGTPHIAGAIGLAAAIDYLTGVGLDQVAAHERDLLAYGTSALGQVPGLRLVGTAANKASILSFVMDGVHPHDIGTIVDQMGVAIRTGHHCTQPVMDRMGIPATARASLAMYSTRGDIDALVAAVGRAREVFA
ncbi:MAG: cysteine desulfurase [Vicinamibacterales bacterium]|jgi:cysteine desulfurase/selenocysteine lyase|nr:cysteine desulfurase CsdA [Acidobacteriota bacterium]MDP7471816.1 cysteine desulfurase [Vicinamibacterales bacterium]MDP7670866.1 cysteine desulfurase [Vicinamibacterales bacterium]HJO39611.1 cysteine desulfurase [Vicinamibacterales bacterium]|tara:strand:+ start:661 stop:1914 length:1254 start_codon:yes stop_codon:yes gene_type:complete